MHFFPLSRIREYAFVVFCLCACSDYAVAEVLSAAPNSTTEPLREIEVSADSWAWSAPDHARVTAIVEGAGKSSEEALAAIEKRHTDITAAVKKIIGENVTTLTRGNELVPTGKDDELQQTAMVHAKRYVGIETTDLEQVGKVLDAVLRSGASSIAEVIYAVRDDSLAKVKAIEKATERAKNQAKALASQLGVSLGPLLTATVTEEPPGAILLEKNRQGEDLYHYSDMDSHIFVTLRFEVSPSDSRMPSS